MIVWGIVAGDFGAKNKRHCQQFDLGRRYGGVLQMFAVLLG